MFYTVIEVQEMENGKRGVLATCHEGHEQALAKLYTVLAAAAVSALPYHAAWLLDSKGVTEEARVFDRRGTEA